MGLPLSNFSGCIMVQQKLPSPPSKKTFRVGRHPSGIVELNTRHRQGRRLSAPAVSLATAEANARNARPISHPAAPLGTIGKLFMRDNSEPKILKALRDLSD